jgi:hypothetical protein
MNLKDIAQKLGGYIKSKTQDDEGFIRQGKFTPLQQIKEKAQQDWKPLTDDTGLFRGNKFGVPTFTPLKALGDVKGPTGVTLKQAVAKLPEQAQQDWGQAGLVRNNQLLQKFAPKTIEPLATAVELGPAAYMNQWAKTATTFSRDTTPVQKGWDILGAYGSLNPAYAGRNLAAGPLGVVFNAASNKINNLRNGNEPDVPLMTNWKQGWQQGQEFQFHANPINQATGHLVDQIAKFVPSLQKFTNAAIASNSINPGDSFKQAFGKWLLNSGKKLLKAATLETAVETPIWATMTKTEQETYLQAVEREALQNLVMNTGMSTLGSLVDARSLAPIVKNSIDTAFENYWKNISTPQGLEAQSGKIDLGAKVGITDQPIKTGGDDLINEARKYKSAEEFVNNFAKNASPEDYLKARIPEITKIEDGYVYTKDGNRIELGMTKYSDGLDISTIMAEKKGTGIGSKIVSALQEWANTRYGTISIKKAYNHGFWEKTGFTGADEYSKGWSAGDRIPGEFTKNKKSQLTDIWNQANKQDFELPEGVMGFAGKQTTSEVSPVKTGGDISNLSPESKGTIKLKDNDLVKTFDKTVKTTETPKVKVRGFTESVQETPKITKGTKVKVAGEYTTKPNDVLMGEAKALLSEGVDLKNINRIENIDQKIAATIQEAINLDAAGKHNEAAALFNNLSELGTQVGRGAQAFSLLNKMSPEAISLSVSGKIKKYNLTHNKKLPKLTGPQQKQLSTQVKEALKFPVGSKERGIALGKVNETINSFIPSTFADKFITVWKAGLLSSLRTHERNIVGNTLMQTSEQASLYPAAGADYLMSLATGKRSLVASQKGTVKGAIEGGQTAADVIKYGFDPMGTDIGKYEIRKVNWGNNPLEQTLKKATDVVFNTLEAEDKVFWKSSYNRSLYNQAATQALNEGKRGNAKYIQKLFDNATEQMKQTAFNDANYATFKDKNMLSGAIGQYKSWVNRQTGPAAEAGKIVSEMLMPFTGVPTSIVGKTVAYSPIGLVKGSVDFGRVVAGSEVPGLQRQAAQEIGRGVIGSGIFGLGAYLMSKGLMTGQAKDQKERDQWALEGKQENSIFVNGKWRSINSVGPQTLVLLAGAKANETANDPEQNLGTYGFSTLNDQLNQTFLSGVQQPLAALNEPYKAKSYLGGQVASLVPNIVKDTSKAFDPLKREVDTSTIGSSIMGRVQQSIPGLRNKMIPQRDVLGNEIAQTPTGIGAYFDLFNSTTPISNNVVSELSRLNEAGYNKTPTKLDKNQTIGGEKMTLNQAQLDRLEIVSGLATDKALNDLFNTTAYQSLNDAEKQDAIGDTITKVRKNVRANIDLSNIQEKSYVKSSDSQLAELGGFNLFTKSVTTDPKAAMNALLTGNPIRKISDGNIVVLERENDVGSYDLGDTTSQVDHAIPLSLGGTNEVRNLQILSNEEHAIKTKTDMYLLDQVQSGKMPLKEAQEKAKKWRDTALSLPKDAQSQMIDEIDSESPDKQSDGSQVYKLVSDTGNVTLVDLGTPIKQPEYTGFDAIDKKLKSSYKSAITKRINNIVKLYEDGQLSAKEANKLIGELNTQYSSGTGTKKKSKKKITFKVTSPKALPKITLKISSPVSRVKLKSAPKIKLSKTDNRKYTIKA